MELYRIVLTGGPCGGKSEAAQKLREYFEQKGWTVFLVPETATELILGGIAPWTCPSRKAFQQAQMRLQIAKEDLYLEYAEKIGGERTIILMDRGTVDSQAFLGEKVYLEAVSEIGRSRDELLARYDQVYHLTSAAKAGMYTTSNNEARREDTEEAAALDDAHLRAWEDHPHRHVIPNFPDFNEKIRCLLDSIEKALEAGERAAVLPKTD